MHNAHVFLSRVVKNGAQAVLNKHFSSDLNVNGRIFPMCSVWFFCFEVIQMLPSQLLVVASVAVVFPLFCFFRGSHDQKNI